MGLVPERNTERVISDVACLKIASDVGYLSLTTFLMVMDGLWVYPTSTGV